MANDVFSDMDSTEFYLHEFGTKQEQRDYLVWVLGRRFGGTYTKEVYIATAMLLKKFSFPAAVLAVKTVHSIEDGSLIPRLIYYCKSYYTVMQAEKTKDVEASVAAIQRVTAGMKLKKVLFHKEDTLFTLLCDGEITKEQYLEGMADEVTATKIIKEVYGSGGAGKEA